MSRNEMQEHNATAPAKGWRPDTQFIAYEYAKPSISREHDSDKSRISTPTKDESQDAMAALMRMADSVTKKKRH
jgi:hypothetical protein